MDIASIKISSAEKSNLDDIYFLLAAQFNEHAIEYHPPDLRRAIAAGLNDDRLGLFLLAWQEEVAIGMAVLVYAWTLEHGGKSAWLDELYVSPQWRSQGIGAALLEKTIEIARAQGCLALDLEVETDHLRAEHLYVRAGFYHLPRRRWVKLLR